MSSSFSFNVTRKSFPPLERRALGRTGAEVSLLGFGALEIGRVWGIGDTISCAKPDEETAERVLNTALDLGINIIDTARAYHDSEERIGNFIGSRRNEFILSSKCGEHSGVNGNFYDFSFDAINRSIDESLKLLHTDSIDIMHVHFGPEPEAVLADGGCLKAMYRARDEGKIKWLAASPRRRGFTGTPNDIMEACIESGAFDILQVHYNILQRDAGPLIEKAARQGIGILVRSGFAMGELTPRAKEAADDPAIVSRLTPYLNLVGGSFELLNDLAWAFLQSNPFISSVLVGTKNVAHLVANATRAAQSFDPTLLEKSVELSARAA